MHYPFPVSAVKKDAGEGEAHQRHSEGRKGEDLGEGIKGTYMGLDSFSSSQYFVGVLGWGASRVPQGQWSASGFQFTLGSKGFCLQRSRFVQSQRSGKEGPPSFPTRLLEWLRLPPAGSSGKCKSAEAGVAGTWLIC